GPLGQPLPRGRARLRRRGDPAVAHPRLHRDGAAAAGAQDRPETAEEAREHTAVSDDQAPVRDDIETPDAATPPEPRIQVLKGQPTDEEVAALIAGLGGTRGGGGRPGPQQLSR